MPRRALPPPADYQEGLRRAVGSALAAYPPGSAMVEETRDERGGVWTIEVLPVRPGAARVTLTFTGGDEVSLGIGPAHASLWSDDVGRLAAEVTGVLAAVFAGHVVVRGPRRDPAVLVRLADGRRWRGGNVIAFATWPFWPARRYAALTPSAPGETG